MFFPPHQIVEKGAKSLPTKVKGTADTLWGPKRTDPRTDFELEFQEISIPTADGPLSAWHIPQQSSEVKKKSVLQTVV